MGRVGKLLVTGGSSLAGLSLGTTYGVQTGMTRLSALQSPLGEELRKLDHLRQQFKKRGLAKNEFEGAAAEAEQEKLESSRISSNGHFHLFRNLSSGNHFQEAQRLITNQIKFPPHIKCYIKVLLSQFCLLIGPTVCLRCFRLFTLGQLSVAALPVATKS